MKWASGLYSLNHQIKSISPQEMRQWSSFIKPSNQINQSLSLTTEGLRIGFVSSELRVLTADGRLYQSPCQGEANGQSTVDHPSCSIHCLKLSYHTSGLVYLTPC